MEELYLEKVSSAGVFWMLLRSFLEQFFCKALLVYGWEKIALNLEFFYHSILLHILRKCLDEFV